MCHWKVLGAAGWAILVDRSSNPMTGPHWRRRLRSLAQIFRVKGWQLHLTLAWPWQKFQGLKNRWFYHGIDQFGHREISNCKPFSRIWKRCVDLKLRFLQVFGFSNLSLTAKCVFQFPFSNPYPKFRLQKLDLSWWRCLNSCVRMIGFQTLLSTCGFNPDPISDVSQVQRLDFQALQQPQYVDQ